MLKILFIIFGYLLGSIPFGVVVARLYRGVDPRSAGSGNIGATNVGRTLGVVAGIITLSGDILKGSIPALVAAYVSGDEVVASLAGLCAFLGHLFPVFLKFKGGKGVATAFGVFLVISPPALFLTVPVFIVLVLATGFVSVGSMAAALTLPLWLILLGERAVYVKLGFIIAALIIYTHRDNIRRLLRGEELPFRR